MVINIPCRGGAALVLSELPVFVLRIGLLLNDSVIAHLLMIH